MIFCPTLNTGGSLLFFTVTFWPIFTVTFKHVEILYNLSTAVNRLMYNRVVFPDSEIKHNFGKLCDSTKFKRSFSISILCPVLRFYKRNNS